MWRSMPQGSAFRWSSSSGIIVYCTIRYYTIRYYIILYYTILCYTMLCYTFLGEPHAALARALGSASDAPNFPTNIVDFRGFDSSLILIVRGGIPRPKGSFLESLSQAMLAGVMLVGRLGVARVCGSRSRSPLQTSSHSRLAGPGCVSERRFPTSEDSDRLYVYMCIHIYIYIYVYIYIQ